MQSKKLFGTIAHISRSTVRLSVFTALAAGSFSLIPGQLLIAQQCPQSAQAGVSPQMSPCGGGYGPRRPIAPSPPPPISFTGTTSQPQIPIGGAPEREGVGSAIFNRSLFVAYTQQQTVDAQGNSYVFVGSSSAGGANYYGGNVMLPQGYPLAGTGNPSLTVNGTNLYLASNDSYGSSGYLTSVDGTTWSSLYGCGGGFTGSPSLTTYKGVVYMALENAADQSLSLCKITAPGQSTLQNFPNINTNFVAGMGVFTPPGGAETLYVAYSTRDNSHAILYYTSTDGVNFNYSTAAAGDQSSTTPSLAMHGNVLYLAFRSNDGDHKLLYKYTRDGANWSGNFYVSGNQMAGPAALVNSSANYNDANYLPGPLAGSAQPGYLFNLYVANDPSKVLYTQYTP